MVQTSETTVRQFLAAWSNADRDELAGFLCDDAVWVDGTQGLRRGATEILDVLCEQLATSRGISPQIATLLSDGDTVMVEWHGGWMMGSEWIAATVMAVFEISDGRIKQMRETYDRLSIHDQMRRANEHSEG